MLTACILSNQKNCLRLNPQAVYAIFTFFRHPTSQNAQEYIVRSLSAALHRGLEGTQFDRLASGNLLPPKLQSFRIAVVIALEALAFFRLPF